MGSIACALAFAGSTAVASEAASTPVHTESTIVYYLGVGSANRWCIADPAHGGKAGGAGTHLVLWGCQPNLWFGWRAVPVNSGYYGHLGYILIVNQANGLCMQATKGLAGGAIFMAKCNPSTVNQIWDALDKNADEGFLQALNSTGNNLNLANNHGTLRDGNAIVGWQTYSTCKQMPEDEFWTALRNASYINVC